MPLLVRVIGMPGSFTQWGVELVFQTLEGAGLSVQKGVLDQKSAPQSPTRNVDVQVLITHGPAFTNDTLAAARGLRTIVFLGQPLTAFEALVAGGNPPRDALRTLTATLAPLPPVLAERATLVVQQSPELTGDGALRAIAHHLALTQRTGAVRAGAPPAAPSAPPLSTETSALARQALLPLAGHVWGTAREAITWPLSCFYHGDRPNESATELIDLVGPARVVCYGPYFHMPRGQWRSEVELYFSDASSTFLVDVFTTDVLAKVRLCPRHRGTFTAAFPLVIEHPEERIEVRLWLERGALEGQVGMRRATFYPEPS